MDGELVSVHFDPDVLDPSVNPIPYAPPNGLSTQALLRLPSEVAAHNGVGGVEITAFHSPCDVVERDALGAFLIDAVTPLLRT